MCSSMVSIAIFGLRDPGSNPSWLNVSNSDQKLKFTLRNYVRYSPENNLANNFIHKETDDKILPS